MKRSILILSLSLVSLTTFATPFSGFYAGAGIGGSQISFKTTQHIQIAPVFGGTPIFNIVIASHPDLTDQSLAGNLEVGFSHVFNQHFYLGLEADADTQSLSDSNPVSVNEIISTIAINGNTKAQLTNEFAVTLDPGIVIGQNTLFYGKIGPAWGNFDVKGSSSYSQNIGGFATVGGSTGFKDDGYQEGLRLGLGVERYISSQFSLKLEYLHTGYDTIHSANQDVTSIGATVPGVTGSLSHSAKVEANNNSVMLGVNFHFSA